MTKEEIVQALRYCANGESCIDCIYTNIGLPYLPCYQKDKDAADLIEAQAERIKELEKSVAVFGQANKELREKLPEWIPVTERLPEQDVPVLARFEDGRIPRQSPDIVLWNGRGWMHVHLHRNVCGITHWMPLPGVEV